MKDVNVTASKGLVIRNFPLVYGHGFAYYLCTLMAKRVESWANRQTNLASINVTKLNAVPIPPFVKQQQIVTKVERRLSMIEELAKPSSKSPSSALNVFGN